MAIIKDGVELIDAKPVPRPGRWASAIVAAILAAMAAHALITNANFQWQVVFQWLFSRSIMQAIATQSYAGWRWPTSGSSAEHLSTRS